MTMRLKQGLTVRGLAALKPGEWANDLKPRGAGQLQARRLANGDLAFYYRYTKPDRIQDRISLGSGLELAGARTKADELSKRYQSGERDLRAVLEAEHREVERERRDAEERAEQKAARKHATLGALLTAYVAQMRREGKASARQVERALELNVRDAWPKLWATPAADVTDDDLMAVVAKLSDADKLRGASKLRSYLRAAYSAAARARHNPRALPALRELRISQNPAANMAPIDGAGTGTRDRALSVSELRAYWRRISALPNPDGALLRFHLLTGAQRLEQLARLEVMDFDSDNKSIRLRDSKGRRRAPRIHVVPLVQDAVAAMSAMRGDGAGRYLFSVTGGYAGASYAVAQHRLRSVVQTMVETGELEGGPFTLGDLRRTVETRLAAAGVTLEVRAQLQSHGLGGVQAKHYDRHDYINEKIEALETLYRILAKADAKVTLLRKGARRRG